MFKRLQSYAGNKMWTLARPTARPPTFIILITRVFRWKTWLKTKFSPFGFLQKK